MSHESLHPPQRVTSLGNLRNESRVLATPQRVTAHFFFVTQPPKFIEHKSSQVQVGHPQAGKEEEERMLPNVHTVDLKYKALKGYRYRYSTSTYYATKAQEKKCS